MHSGHGNDGFSAEEIGAVTHRQGSAIEKRPSTIVVIGTGDFGRSLATHMKKKGFNVILGSRDPQRHRHQIPDDITILRTSEALTQSDLVCLAVPLEAFDTLDPNLFSNKIVIDVSNRTKRRFKFKTNAESLQDRLFESKVVKAFNTLSAYALLQGSFQGSKEVPICSNHDDATERVSVLIGRLGFTPVDHGRLSNAKAIEDIPWGFFPGWHRALILAISFFTFAFSYMIIRWNVCLLDDPYTDAANLFMSLPVDEWTISVALTAQFLLTSCYMPGVIASYIQLFRGTKYSSFPNWLDKWLKMRREIGILVFLFALYHILMALVLEAQFFSYSNWKSFLILFTGATAFFLVTLLAISSLPSVSERLTWSEFSFIHRYFGWWALTLATLHPLFMIWEGLIKNNFDCIFLPHETQLFIWYPMVTVMLKIPLVLPFVHSPLMKIRSGHSRGGTARKGTQTSAGDDSSLHDVVTQ